MQQISEEHMRRALGFMVPGYTVT